jgi:Domain of unknown function (DUF4062)
MDQFRVFISAVTSEFGSARDALANDLQSHDDLIVRVQRSFRYDDNAETLLHKLRNYIETCDVVIFLIGTRSGTGFPTAIEAERFGTISRSSSSKHPTRSGRCCSPGVSTRSA